MVLLEIENTAPEVQEIEPSMAMPTALSELSPAIDNVFCEMTNCVAAEDSTMFPDITNPAILLKATPVEVAMACVLLRVFNTT